MVGLPQFPVYYYVFVMLIDRWIYLYMTRRATARMAVAGASLMAVLYGATMWRYEGSVVLFDYHLACWRWRGPLPCSCSTKVAGST